MKICVPSVAAVLLLAGAAFAQPANDNCSSAQAITGFGQTSFDTTGASTDGPGISCGGGNSYNDVWFTWTSDFTGSVQVDLCTATTFDTVMAAYDGAGCPSGSELACNDDSCGLSSKVTFDAVSGQQYTIRVGAYSDGTTGSGVVTISQAPPPHVIAGPFNNPGNGHDYYLLDASSWHDAEANAVGIGGHLATVRNDDENAFIYYSVMKYDGFPSRRGWIGLTDEAQEGTYVWTSGEPVTFTDWAAGEPNHANGTEFYAQIPWYSNLWNDNSDFPGDDPCYGIAEVFTATPPACPADLGTAGGLPGQDGALDNNDFIAFINYFFNADSHADLGVAGGLPGSDGQYDNNDFIAFISFFFNGCS